MAAQSRRRVRGFNAGMAGAKPVELWEITDVAERAVPNVDLSFGTPPARG